MEAQVTALVPSKDHAVYVLNGDGGSRHFKKPDDAIDWLRKHNSDGLIVIASMGGPGQELLSRVVQMVLVHRVPIYRLQQVASLTPKSTPEERGQALQLAWSTNSDLFYPMEELDPTIVLIRELTRQRLSLQDFRKPAQNQLHGALRRLEWVLPEESHALIELLRRGLKELFKSQKTRDEIEAEFTRLEQEVRLTSVQQAHLFAIRRFFSNPRFILGAKADEVELETRITSLLKRLPIWPWFNPHGSNLPAIKGFGPSIGGSVTSEIGDIRRFQTPEALRAYARFHVTGEGKFPRRVAGELSSWNRYLNRAVWLWSTDQMPRYDHPWRILYYWRKAREFQSHPEPVTRQATDKRGRQRTVYDYTLKHLDSRAKRWTGSQLLNYIWDLWQVVARADNPEAWYAASSWPAYFERIERELNDGLLEYMKAEIAKRRRIEPESEEDSEEEEE